MSCSSGSSRDTYPDSVDAPDAAGTSVVEANGAGENTENAATKTLSSQGDISGANALVSSSQSGNTPAVTPVSNDNVVRNLATSDLVEGMPYIEARTTLIQQGWIPLEQPEPAAGVERQLYDLGIKEVSACSGTGVGYCSFSFYKLDSSRPEGHLRFGVTTVGGSKVEVSSWGSNFVEGPPPLLANDFQADSSQPVAAQATNVGSSGSTQQRTYIPVQFRGLWNASTDECSIPYSQGRLEVKGDQISFYESSGPVEDVTSRGEYEVTVKAALMSEGTPFTKTVTFQLSEDYSTLTDKDAGFVRYRCPDV